MFNVFLERREDFRRYLTRLHHLAGDRPLVLGEIGLDAGTARGRASAAGGGARLAARDRDRARRRRHLRLLLDRRVVGRRRPGRGLALRPHPRGPLAAARRSRSPPTGTGAPSATSTSDWPSISVVICAHNAERHDRRVPAPHLRARLPGPRVIVVDDGSTDETAEIVARHPRARLLSIAHAGLVGRPQRGLSRRRRGDLIAYLDSDAYPTPEWPYYLALGLDAPDVGGVGGPNLPPADDPLGAHVVARSPGGPGPRAHLRRPGRARPRLQHGVLEASCSTEVGGFDPIYTSAGDDVDLCWKVLDADWKIGFHPAALVWHHRRPGLRAYLRQQRGYGRSEALVEARHPDRFTPRRHGALAGAHLQLADARRSARQRIYRGVYGTAAYQSVYHGGRLRARPRPPGRRADRGAAAADRCRWR